MLRKLWNCISFTATWTTLGLLIFVLFNASQLEMAYMEKYENAYDQMIQEHEQQLIIAEAIRSQQAWMKSADASRQDFLGERTERQKAERNLRIHQFEVYAFFKILLRKYPEVYAEINEILGDPNAPLLPFSTGK